MTKVYDPAFYKIFEITPFYDKTLSWQAKGLYGYLSSTPGKSFDSSWEFSCSPEELEIIEAAIKELVQKGYVELDNE